MTIEDKGSVNSWRPRMNPWASTGASSGDTRHGRDPCVMGPCFEDLTRETTMSSHARPAALSPLHAWSGLLVLSFLIAWILLCAVAEPACASGVYVNLDNCWMQPHAGREPSNWNSRSLSTALSVGFFTSYGGKGSQFRMGISIGGFTCNGASESYLIGVDTGNEDLVMRWEEVSLEGNGLVSSLQLNLVAYPIQSAGLFLTAGVSGAWLHCKGTGAVRVKAVEMGASGAIQEFESDFTYRIKAGNLDRVDWILGVGCDLEPYYDQGRETYLLLTMHFGTKLSPIGVQWNDSSGNNDRVWIKPASLSLQVGVYL